MNFEYGIEPIAKAHDFTEVKSGASLWVKKKHEALTLCRDFNAWAAENGALLAPSWEKVGQADPRGAGYRLHFREAARYKMPVNDASLSTAVKTWIADRAVCTQTRPAEGWHLVSKLHLDYLEWFDNSSFPAGMRIDVARFSALISAIDGLHRSRVSQGSVIIGLALKGVALGIPRHGAAAGETENKTDWWPDAEK